MLPPWIIAARRYGDFVVCLRIGKRGAAPFEAGISRHASNQDRWGYRDGRDRDQLGKWVVRLGGLEPPTSGSTIRRS